MISFVYGALIAASIVGSANAECANACNGHGKCTAYDMCICNRNWQGNDCSQRTCQFGLAHVDSPKGDLDMSGALTGPDHPVVLDHPVYPYGTTEQFPQMQDSDLRTLTNSGHYYMECSNKGSCNRATGECSCYDGYDGVACQRASCPGFPNSCSGHGVCKTIAQLAAGDTANSYKLWDRESTMGCECDPGYYGPDCSLRDCKWGIDPLYLDDSQTSKYSTFDFAVLTTGLYLTDGQGKPGTGTWAIRFFDVQGEDWVTTAIPAWATCQQVIDALEGLPNNVIPSGTVKCSRTEYSNSPSESTYSLQWDGVDNLFTRTGHTYNIHYRMAAWNALTSAPELLFNLPESFNYSDTGMLQHVVPSFVGDIYRIRFTGNPGALKEPMIETYLNGKNPSLLSPGNVVTTYVFTDGQQGETSDYISDHCDGVSATIAAITSSGTYYSDYVALAGLSTTEIALLKACLGDADFDTTNNVDVYNWDYGSTTFLHLIKLVRTVTSYMDGGYYAALFWNSGTSEFRLVNPFVPPDGAASDTYDIYTTKGTLALTSANANAVFGYGQRSFFTVNNAIDATAGATLGTTMYSPYDGTIACEDASALVTANVAYCLNHSDIFTILDVNAPARNSPYINLYTAKRVWTKAYAYNVSQAGFDTQFANAPGLKYELHRGTHRIDTDLTLNWGSDDQGQIDTAHAMHGNTFQVWKFFPAAASTYQYVAPCSNRGICNTDTGVCQCFPGYTTDSCSTQNSLAL